VARAKENGYEAEIVVAFVHAHGTYREDGRLWALNDKRVDAHLDAMIQGWAKRSVVPLSRLDTFLCKYDLMLFEYEIWAEEHYGRTGWVEDCLRPKRKDCLIGAKRASNPVCTQLCATCKTLKFDNPARPSSLTTNVN